METNKEKFPHLRTGYTLLTSNTKRWSEDEIRKNDEVEARIIFRDFTEEDFGISRERVATCTHKEYAKEIVTRCNGYSALQSENEKWKNLACDLTNEVADLKDIMEQDNFKQKKENERLREALKNVSSLLDFAINATQTGAVRNLLTDANIIALSALNTSTVKEVGSNG